MPSPPPIALHPEADAFRARLGTRSIVLVGMPGSGKSSIGRRLGQRLGLDFADADAEIERAANMTIPELFQTKGEAEFRKGEQKVIARLLEGGPQVIATGGGAFVNADTRMRIKEKGVSIWLKADVETLLRRVKRKSNRPLLQNADPEGTLRNLLSAREATYAEADLIITSCEVPHEEVVEAIVNLLDTSLTERAT
ncbi:MAG: shikimate kinase [Xanthobacteraceae bacterium]|nr:shikimate kinase [Xanthobacteraceae bacterium]